MALPKKQTPKTSNTEIFAADAPQTNSVGLFEQLIRFFHFITSLKSHLGSRDLLP
jgi:hypothetical protein